MVLAFGFAVPWLLWGCLAAAIPWLIHWLFRRRYRETPWAAMQFLAAAAQRQSRWSRIDQWLLLLVRTAIPLIAAAALAGPLLDDVVGAAFNVPVHRMLVADVSLSTQALDAGHSRWAAIRDAAAELAETARSGDTWQLLTLGSVTPQTLIAEPALQSAPVFEELKLLEATSESGHTIDGLARAAALLPQQGHERREVHLLTDGQRSQWRPESVAERERVRTQLAELSGQALVIWHDVSRQAVGNVAVTEVTLSKSQVMVSEPLRAQARIERFGDAPLPATVEWRVEDRLVAVQPLDFADGTSATAELTYVPTAAGELRIEARIPADALTADDQRGVVAVARSRIQVLLIDGRPSGVPLENATDFVRLALAPQMVGSAAGRIEPTVMTEGQLAATNLPDFDVVFLCDVPRLTDREGRLLADYVAQGGGLVMALGPAAKVETYEESLLTPQRPLLPARLGPIVGDPRSREQAFGFTGDDYRHAILEPFRGNPNTGFELTQTFAYRRLQPTPTAEVAVKFDNGDPAIVTGTFGRGRVVVLATSVDRSWGTWAVWGHTFVPMMHELVRYLLAGQMENRQVRVGNPLQIRLPPGTSDQQLQVRNPRGELQGLSMAGADPAAGSARGGVFEATELPGFYAVERSGGTFAPQWYAVNVDPTESNLTPLSSEELREGLFAGRPLETGWSEERATIASAPVRPGQDVARWLLAAALMLLVAEPFFAGRRRLALVMMSSFVVLGLVGNWWGPPGAVGVAGLLVVLAVAAWGWHRWGVNRRVPAGEPLRPVIP